jgi:hypothetical protein
MKSDNTIDQTIALLEKAKASKTQSARVNRIRDAQEKLDVALKQAKGPDDDPTRNP